MCNYFTTIATIIIIVSNSKAYLNYNGVKQINLPVLECIFPDMTTNYAILIGDNDSLGHSAPLVRFSVANLQENIAKLHLKPSIYIFEFIDPNRLDYALEVIKNSENFKPAKFFILCDSEVELQQFVDVLWKFKLLNSVLVSNHLLKAYTIQLHECGAKSTPKYIGTCPKVNHPYLNHLKNNFIGCPIRVIWVRHPPFVFDMNSPTEPLKGIFIDFLDSLAYITKRPLIIAPNDSEYLEDVAENFNYDSVLEDLKEIEIFASCFGTNQMFYPSPVMNVDHILMVVPRTYLNYWKLFSHILWQVAIIVAGTIAIAGIVVHYLRKRRDGVGNSLDNMLNLVLFLYGTLLGIGNRNQLPRFSILRLYFSHLLFMFMVIGIYVQGALVISVLSGSLFEPPIMNLRQLAVSNIPFKITALFKSMLKLYPGLSTDPDLIQLINRVQIINEPILLNTLDDLIKHKDYATITINALIMLRPNLIKRFSYFPLTRLFISFGMDKNSFHSPQFSHWILQGLETGFMEKYKRLYQFQLALKWNVELEEKVFVLTMEQVQPAVKLLLVMHCMASVMFILEIIYYNVTHKLLHLK